MLVKINKIIVLAVVSSASVALADMEKMPHKHHKSAGDTGVGVDTSKTFDTGMQAVLTEYLQIHQELMSVTPDLNKIKSLSKKLAELTKKLGTLSVNGKHADHYKDIPANLKTHADMMSKHTELQEVRNSFKKLSQPVAMWVGMAKPSGYAVMYCPMVKASWVQKEGDTQNPYDSKMPRCGSRV